MTLMSFSSKIDVIQFCSTKQGLTMEEVYIPSSMVLQAVHLVRGDLLVLDWLQMLNM